VSSFREDWEPREGGGSRKDQKIIVARSKEGIVLLLDDETQDRIVLTNEQARELAEALKAAAGQAGE
jgi:hypothetical protein